MPKQAHRLQTEFNPFPKRSLLSIKSKWIGWLAGILLWVNPAIGNGVMAGWFGGPAPISDGLLILFIIALIYAAWKIYRNWEKLTE